MRQAGAWIGIGRDLNTQPDLFETVYRAGFWRVAVCKFCFVRAILNASNAIDQVEAVLTQRSKA